MANSSELLDSLNRATPEAVDVGARPRVCFVIDRLSIAGTETQVLHLINHIDQRSCKPYLVLLDGESPESRALEPDCCPVMRMGVQRLKSLHAVRSAIRLSRFLREQRIDIVQAYFPDSTLIGFIAARLAGVPHFVRNRRSLGYNLTTSARWTGRMLSKTSMKTAANSQACRHAIIEQERAQPDSVVVIPNGIDLDRFANLDLPRQEIGKPKIGMVANLRPVKDPFSFLRAAIELQKEFNSLRFEIAGEGELRAPLQKLIDEAGLQEQFKLVGQVSEVVGFLESLDVAVSSSTSEGLSNSIIEYMAAARPIVATNIDGNQELIEHTVNGLLVEPEQPEQFASAIRRLLQDRPLARHLGIAAREQATVNYGLRLQAERFETFWQTMIQESQGN